MSRTGTSREPCRSVLSSCATSTASHCCRSVGRAGFAFGATGSALVLALTVAAPASGSHGGDRHPGRASPDGPEGLHQGPGGQPLLHRQGSLSRCPPRGARSAPSATTPRRPSTPNHRPLRPRRPALHALLRLDQPSPTPGPARPSPTVSPSAATSSRPAGTDSYRLATTRARAGQQPAAS